MKLNFIISWRNSLFLENSAMYAVRKVNNHEMFRSLSSIRLASWKDALTNEEKRVFFISFFCWVNKLKKNLSFFYRNFSSNESSMNLRWISSDKMLICMKILFFCCWLVAYLMDRNLSCSLLEFKECTFFLSVQHVH